MTNTTSTYLLSRINAAASKLGIAPSTFCQRFVKNSKLPIRLQAGQTVTLKTYEKLLFHIDQADRQAPNAEA